MIKRLLVSLALLPAFASARELSAGTFELSGFSTLDFATGSTKQTGGGASVTTDSTSYAVLGSGLYYVIPNLGVGLSLGYDHSTSKWSGTPVGSPPLVSVVSGEFGSSSVSVGPAVSYEIPIADQFALFGLGQLSYRRETFTQAGSPDVHSNGWGLGVAAGLKYFVVKNFSLDAGVGYNYARVKDDQTPSTTSSSSGFGLNVGLSVYFGGSAGGH